MEVLRGLLGRVGAHRGVEVLGQGWNWVSVVAGLQVLHLGSFWGQGRGLCIRSKRNSDRRWGQVVCRDVSGLGERQQGRGPRSSGHHMLSK